MNIIKKFSAILKSIILFSPVFLLGQSRESESEWFPLTRGYQWTYSDGYTTFSEKVMDSLQIHGKVFHTIESDGQLYNWFRTSNDTVFGAVRYSLDTIEAPIYTFNGEIGDSISLPSAFSCSYGRWITLVSKNDTISTPSGIYTGCYHFKHYPGCSDGGLFDSWIARGVGTVQFSANNFAGVTKFQLVSMGPTLVNLGNENINMPYNYLFNNFPNPFNPQTTIKFSVRKEGRIVIYVSDVNGRTVATLINEVKQLGTYQVIWNVSKLSSGTYFLHFSSENGNSIKKMILLK